MTNAEVKSILPPRHGWLPWNRMGYGRTIILALVGAAAGFASGAMSSSFFTRPAVQTHSLSAIVYKGYITLIIDRTRVTWCDVQPTRVAFQDDTINGETLPMVLPMSSQSLVWPFLGRQKFGLMVIRAKDLAPGEWSILTTQRGMCHWYNYLIGPDVTITQATVTVPQVPTEGQVH